PTQVVTFLASPLFWFFENLVTQSPAFFGSEPFFISGSSGGTCSAYFFFQTSTFVSSVPCSLTNAGFICWRANRISTVTTTSFIPSSITLTTISFTSITITSIIEFISTISTSTTV